jgi:hypothetical protein
LGQTVSQISKQRVDELLKVVALVGAHRDKVVENLVVAPGVELLSQRSQTICLDAAEPNRVTNGFRALSL